jgi:hypothetical protein
LGIAIAAGAAASRLLALVRADRWLPYWDSAGHGLAGLDLSHAIQHLDPIAFVDTLNRQTTWPFVHGLLLVPFFLILGDDYVTSNIASTVFYALAVVTIFSAGLGLHPRRGPWVGVVAAALALASPAFAFFGTVTMLEIPGALLLALALACHAQANRREDARPWLVASGITAVGLFFCKYNYGVLWLMPLAAFEVGLHCAAERRVRMEAFRVAVRRGLWRRPVPLLILVFVVFAAAILVTGGIQVTILGQRISMRSPGNAATALYLVLVAWFIWRWVSDPARWWGRWRRLSGRVRVLAGIVLVPIGVWFLVPPHLREFVGFLVNRSGGPSPWTLERFLYYPVAFVKEYSPLPWLGAIVLLLALMPGPRRRPDRHSTRDPGALLGLALGLGLAATMLHPYQQPRFLFTTAVLIWLRAATTAVAWLEHGSERWQARRLAFRTNGSAAPGASPAESRDASLRWALLEAAWVVALALLVFAAAFVHPPLERLRADRRSFLAPPGFAAVLDHVLATSAADSRGVLLGYGNQLSPALLAWHAAIQHSDLSRAQLPKRLPWLPSNASEEAIRQRIEGLRAAGGPVYSALPWAPDAIARREIRLEIAADSITSERLMHDPGVLVMADGMVKNTGYRLQAFRFYPREAMR